MLGRAPGSSPASDGPAIGRIGGWRMTPVTGARCMFIGKARSTGEAEHRGQLCLVDREMKNASLRGRFSKCVCALASCLQL